MSSSVAWVLRRRLPLVVGSLAIATLGPYLGSLPIRALPEVITLAEQSSPELPRAIGMLVAFGMASAALGLLGTRVGSTLSARAVANLRLHVHDRLMARPPDVVRAHANRVRSGLLEQTRMVASFATNTVPSTVGVVVAVVIWGGTLWSTLASSQHRAAAGLIVGGVIVSMVATSAGMSLLAGRKTRKLQSAVIEAHAELAGLAVESVDDLTELQLHVAGGAQHARLAAVSDRMAAAEIRVAAWSGSATAASGALLLLAIPLAVVAWSALEVPSAQLTVLIPSLMMLQRAVAGVGSLWTSYRLATPAIELVDELIAPSPTISDAADAREPVAGPGRVELAHVAWSAGDREILRDVTLDITPGECVALVGKGGSGKSSVLRLLVRLSDPTRGTIALDGAPLVQLSRAALRRRVVLLDQHPAFFARTVRDNLLLDGTPRDDARILALADRVQAREVIEQLPGGLDHKLPARGGTLSGSERRRLALVRMLLRDPEVVLLDELEAGLPQAMAQSLFAAVREVTRGKTCIVVTHRPDLLHADRVAVIHEGAVLATGTHEELEQSCEPYRSLLAEKESRA